MRNIRLIPVRASSRTRERHRVPRSRLAPSVHISRLGDHEGRLDQEVRAGRVEVETVPKARKGWRGWWRKVRKAMKL